MKVVTAKDMQTGPGPEDWFTGDGMEGRCTYRLLPRRGRQPRPVRAWCPYALAYPPGRSDPLHRYGHLPRRERGRAARRGRAGGVVYFAPDEKHWHGATPETYMVHMAINVATTTDGGTDWLEPVTDEEYAGE